MLDDEEIRICKQNFLIVRQRVLKRAKLKYTERASPMAYDWTVNHSIQIDNQEIL